MFATQIPPPPIRTLGWDLPETYRVMGPRVPLYFIHFVWIDLKLTLKMPSACIMQMFVLVPQFYEGSPIWAECKYWSIVWKDHPEIFSLLSAMGKVLTCAVRKTQHPTEWDTAVPGEGENQKVAQQQGMANELRRDGQRPQKPSYPFITIPCVLPVILGWFLAALPAGKCCLVCV